MVTALAGHHFITEGFLLPPICQLDRRRFSLTRRQSRHQGNVPNVSLELDTSWDQVVAPIGVGIPSRSQNR